MLATIWMCTQEWSLISIRTTAFTFETCHHAFTCLSSLTRSSSLRSLRLPRTGRLMRIFSTACAGREARLADRLLRDRLLDPLLGLLVEVDHVRTTTLRANLSCSAWFRRVAQRPEVVDDRRDR